MNKKTDVCTEQKSIPEKNSESDSEIDSKKQNIVDTDVNKQKRFSEKHPKLNLLLGFIILFAMLAVALWGAWYVANQIKDAIQWLVTTVSKLDAVIIVALITGSVSIFGVVVSSVVGKYIDYKTKRQEYLTQKREASYGEFVDMVYKIQRTCKNKNEYTQEEMTSDISKFSKQLTLWGSHRVVNKWVEFREKGANPKFASDNLFLMEDIMNEMRHDLGLKKVKKGNLLAFFVNDIKDFMKKNT